LEDTIKTTLDDAKSVIDDISNKMKTVFELLTSPVDFGNFLLDAIEAIW